MTGTPSTPGDTLAQAPPSPVDAGGRIAFGTYQGRVERIDWAPVAPGPAWRLRRWKRWHYVSIAGPEVVLAVAVVDLGWAGTGFCYLFDRTRRRLLADVEVVGPPGRAASVSPVPGGPVPTRFGSRRLHVHLAADGLGGWRLEARCPALTVDATLRESAAPTLCAVAPVPGGVADCTHKTPALTVEGIAGAGGARFDLSGCHGALDHTSGLLARATRWRWASGTDGRLALNLTEDFTAPHENALWVEGSLRRLGPVRFAFDAASPESPWHITADDGSVDLEFVPEGRREKRTRLVVAESSYVQPVGSFRGTAGGVAVDMLPGVTEDHVARW